MVLSQSRAECKSSRHRDGRSARTRIARRTGTTTNDYMAIVDRGWIDMRRESDDNLGIHADRSSARTWGRRLLVVTFIHNGRI